MYFPPSVRLACKFEWRCFNQNLELRDGRRGVDIKRAHGHDKLHQLQSGWAEHGLVLPRHDHQALEAQQGTGIQVLQDAARSRPRGLLRRIRQATGWPPYVMFARQHNKILGFEYRLPPSNTVIAFRVGTQTDTIAWRHDDGVGK